MGTGFWIFMTVGLVLMCLDGCSFTWTQTKTIKEEDKE